MILADTSVWVQHFRQDLPDLIDLLLQERIVTHMFVIGELALGSLADRRATLDDLLALPQAAMVADDHVLGFIDDEHLFGTGLGYVDVSLLSCALAADDVKLWTFDRRLAGAAERLGVGFSPAQ